MSVSIAISSKIKYLINDNKKIKKSVKKNIIKFRKRLFLDKEEF